MLSEDIIRADGTIGPLGQRFEDAIPAQSGSGGPITHDLGNFDIPGGDEEFTTVWSPAPVIDLGPGLHMFTYTVTLVTIDWGGGDPANGLNIDLGFTETPDLDPEAFRVATLQPGQNLGWGAGRIVDQGIIPPGLYTTDTEAVEYAARGMRWGPRYGWLARSWNETLPDASATVHITLVQSL